MAAGNVNRNVFRVNPRGSYPACRWDPKTGDMKICQSAADVPEGWLSYHPKDPMGPIMAAREAAAAAAKAAPVPAPAKPVGNVAPPRKSGAPDPKPAISSATMPDRAVIVADLNKKGIKFNASSPTKALYELLVAFADANEG